MDGLCPSLSAKTCFANSFNKFEYKILPPERIELSTPGLQDQCSATELKRLVVESCKLGSQWQVQILFMSYVMVLNRCSR